MTDSFSPAEYCLRSRCRRSANWRTRLVPLALFVACLSLVAQQNQPIGQQTEHGTDAGADNTAYHITALQKATQNTVASIMSIPIENKSSFNAGPYDRNQNIVNIKPILPVQLSTNWNLIVRIIQPVVWQPRLDQKEGGDFGLGDMNPTFFLSPATHGELKWGAGPTFIIPTATNGTLGQGKLSIGPELAVFFQPGHWTVGVLVSNVWSVSGSGGRPSVNQMQLQYFVTYNLKYGWYLTTTPILTANWKGSSGNVWTIPLGGGVGKIMKFGFQPVNISAKVYANSVRPAGASPCNMQLQMEFLFPRN